jgi:hypothetical protein
LISRTSSRGDTFRSSEEPSKQATQSVISGSASLSAAVSASSLSACWFFAFLDGRFGSLSSVTPSTPLTLAGGAWRCMLALAEG